MYLCARPDRLTTYKFVMSFYAFHENEFILYPIMELGTIDGAL